MAWVLATLFRSVQKWLGCVFENNVHKTWASQEVWTTSGNGWAVVRLPLVLCCHVRHSFPVGEGVFPPSKHLRRQNTTPYFGVCLDWCRRVYTSSKERKRVGSCVTQGDSQRSTISLPPKEASVAPPSCWAHSGPCRRGRPLSPARSWGAKTEHEKERKAKDTRGKNDGNLTKMQYREAKSFGNSCLHGDVCPSPRSCFYPSGCLPLVCQKQESPQSTPGLCNVSAASKRGNNPTPKTGFPPGIPAGFSSAL